MRTVGTVHDVNIAIIPRIGDGAGWVITAEKVSYEFVSGNVITLQIIQRPKELKDEPIADPPQPARAPSVPFGRNAVSGCATCATTNTLSPPHAPSGVTSTMGAAPALQVKVEQLRSVVKNGVDGVKQEEVEIPTAELPKASNGAVAESATLTPSNRLDIAKRPAPSTFRDVRKRRRVLSQPHKLMSTANSNSTGSSIVVTSSALAVVPRRRITNYNRPVCDRGDCTSFAVGRVYTERLCKRHGGGPRCTVPQCPNASIGHVEVDDDFGPAGDRCRRHRGARICCVPGCDTASFAVVQQADHWGEPGPRCKRHGGGGRCNVKGCSNCAAGRVQRDDEHGVAGGRCKAHGAGAMCRYPGGCTKLATGGKVVVDEALGTLEYRCSHHGGGRRCEVPDCVNLATGRVRVSDEFGSAGEKRCRRHGGGLKCSVHNCPTLAIRKITQADKFGPAGRRCAKHAKGSPEGAHSPCGAPPLQNSAPALHNFVPALHNSAPLPTSVDQRCKIEVEQQEHLCT
eukprot:GEMP01018918.1.p1 GENE.GEMP01018918.1~~GEMP01018918.1.p1  ORF type:complete len:513 (+),score=126.34 GEMP01018918.1:66-1604(+)